MPYWFRTRLAPAQVASWLLLTLSIPLAGAGVHLLRGAGRPAGRGEAGRFAFENTTELVTSGVYRYIRHPMYASLLCLLWGALLKHPSLSRWPLAALATLFVVLTATAEERENQRRFGEKYAAYCRRTTRFVPFVY